MRVAIAGLNQESNAFALDRSTRSDFVEVSPEKIERVFRRTSTEIAGFLDVATATGAQVMPAGFAYAETGGLLERPAAEDLCAEIADRIIGARPDIVLLALHGSMAAEGIDDVEGLLLGLLRQGIGPDPVVACTLDWHCSITPAMTTGADLLVAYRTYPHVDQKDRAVTAAGLAVRSWSGEIRPTSASAHPPLIIAGPATSHLNPPMHAVLAAATDLVDRHPRVLDWSICPGYARSDVPEAGVHTHVVADDDPQLAGELADRLAALVWSQRRAFRPELVDLAEAVGAAADGREGRLVLSDQGDNPGGGAAGNSVVLLEALLGAGVDGVVVCALWDPDAVGQAMAAGRGADVDLSLGRRPDGRPLPVTARVLHLADGRYTMRSPTHDGVRRRIGPTATLGIAGAQVVVTSSRVQNEDLQLLTMAGIDPAEARVLVVKSNAHFRAAFGPLADRILDVDTPGLSTPRLERLPFRRIDRPIYPLDESVTWPPPVEP